MVASEPRTAGPRPAQLGDPRPAAAGTAIARLAYLDTSAFVKIPFAEREHTELERELDGWGRRVSSTLLVVEAVRSGARKTQRYIDRVRDGLRQVDLLPIDQTVIDLAARVEPPLLRSLDAIHLATALSLRDDLGAFITYDVLLREAAQDAGLPAVSPGA